MSILSNRLKYVLSPQADIYKQISEVISGCVADVGCGLGFGANLLLKNTKLVYGYDIEYLDFAKWAFPKVKFSEHDITIEPLPHNYDYIIMIDVIEHIEKDELAIRNCYNSLKPKGKLIVSTPNKLSRYRKSENHVREYTPVELKTLLEKVFKDIKLMSFNCKTIETGYENPIIAFCKETNL